MNYLQKPLELAQSSNLSIQNLLQVETQILNIYAPLSAMFSSFFTILENAVSNQMNYNQFSIDRYNLAHFDIPSFQEIQPDGIIKKATKNISQVTPNHLNPLVSLTLSMLMTRKKMLESSIKPLSQPIIQDLVSDKGLSTSETTQSKQTISSQTPKAALANQIGDLQSQIKYNINLAEKISLMINEYRKKTIPIASTTDILTVAQEPTENDTIAKLFSSKTTDGKSGAKFNYLTATRLGNSLPALKSTWQKPAIQLSALITAQQKLNQPQLLPNSTFLSSPTLEPKTDILANQILANAQPDTTSSEISFNWKENEVGKPKKIEAPSTSGISTVSSDEPLFQAAPQRTGKAETKKTRRENTFPNTTTFNAISYSSNLPFLFNPSKTEQTVRANTSPNITAFDAISYASNLPFLFVPQQQPFMNIKSTLMLSQQPILHSASESNRKEQKREETEFTEPQRDSGKVSSMLNKAEEKSNGFSSGLIDLMAPSIHFALTSRDIISKLTSRVMTEENDMAEKAVNNSAISSDNSILKTGPNNFSSVFKDKRNTQSPSTLSRSNSLKDNTTNTKQSPLALLSSGLIVTSSRMGVEATKSLEKIFAVGGKTLTLPTLSSNIGFEAAPIIQKSSTLEVSNLPSTAKPSPGHLQKVQHYSLSVNQEAEDSSKLTPSKYERSREYDVQQKARGNVRLQGSIGLPAASVLANSGQFIVNQMRSKMTQISKTAQDALSVYEGSLDGYSIVEPARIEALAKTAESTYSAPIEISPLAPEVTPHPLLETVSSSPAIHDTINVSVSADTAEEDLRDLERKINRILQEQVNRYYGSPRI